MEGLIPPNDTKEIQAVKKADVDDENNFPTVFSVRSCENSGTQIFGNNANITIYVTNQFGNNSTSKEQTVGCLGSDSESDSLDGIADGGENERQLEIERASNVQKITNVPIINEAYPQGLSCTLEDLDKDIEWCQSEMQKVLRHVLSICVSMIAVRVWTIVPYIAYSISFINCMLGCMRCLKIKLVKPLKGGIGDISEVSVWFGFGITDLSYLSCQLLSLLLFVRNALVYSLCSQYQLGWIYTPMIILFVHVFVYTAICVFIWIKLKPVKNKFYNVEMQIQQINDFLNLMKLKRKSNQKNMRKRKSI